MRLGTNELKDLNVISAKPQILDGITYKLHLDKCYNYYGKPVTKSNFLLNPGDFVLGQTQEIVTIPSNLVGILEGKSSIARKGVIIHVTSSRIDPTFSGPIVLEIYNLNKYSFTLVEGMEIAALGLEELTSASTYNGKYRSNNNVDR